MLAVLEQWEDDTGCHRDNMGLYILLVLSKFGLDVYALWLYNRTRLHTSLLGMFSLTIVLADLVMAFFMVTMWLLGPERISACFLMAFASATYGTLPLPMVCLCLLDYCLEDTWRTSYKALKNITVTLLVWTFAGVYSYISVNMELMELTYAAGKKALVCEIQDTTMITYFLLGLLGIMICSMLPFCSRILLWMCEARRLYKARENQENQWSDLHTSIKPSQLTMSEEIYYLGKTTAPRPPLWFSLMLGFGVYWMPYLVITAACLVLGFWVPAYIAVNLLWLECTDSVMVAVMFWAKSPTQGPYARVSQNVCSWEVYWHLSNGAHNSDTMIYTLSHV
ncbi:probable G-protein coupled receptor 160 [Dunckerocampus dactyliophorus]|uniref:probable G-protein coupled receptor 160 n=1 Tax=Dunckerocampus dactyliophorus TaxID=161453 RepID=UPI00240498CB|nr:probable G-protein coupled receptor 160 [Dunckerocampus dactyliophorus]